MYVTPPYNWLVTEVALQLLQRAPRIEEFQIKGYCICGVVGVVGVVVIVSPPPLEDAGHYVLANLEYSTYVTETSTWSTLGLRYSVVRLFVVLEN